MNTNTAAISVETTDAPTVTITQFPALDRPRGQHRSLTWPALLATLSRPRTVAAKSAAPGWSAATFTGDHRGAERVEQVALLGYDLDQGIEREELEAKLQGVQAIVHSTWSHRIPKRGEPAVPRWRLLVAISRPLRGCEYAAAWAAVRDRLGLEADEGAKDAGRFWYLPSCTRDRVHQFEAFEVEGTPIDVSGIDLTVAVRPVRQHQPGTGAYAPTAFDPSALDSIAAPLGAQLALLDRRGVLVGNRSELAMVLGQALYDEGLDAPAVLRRAAHLAAQLGADVDLDDDGRGPEGWARRAVDAAADKPARRFGSLAYEHPRLAQVLRRSVDAEYLRSGDAPAMVQPAAAEDALLAALERGDDLIAVTAGAGKSRAARAYIARLRENNENAAVFVPTHDLADQYRQRFVVDHAVKPGLRRRSLLSVAGCARPDSLRAAAALGGRASDACQACPVREGCAAREAVGRLPKIREPAMPADVSVQMHTRLAEHLDSIRLDTERGYIAPSLVVIDEPPAATISGKVSELAQVDDVADLLSPIGTALSRVLAHLQQGAAVTDIDVELVAAAKANGPIWRTGTTTTTVLSQRRGQPVLKVTPALEGLREALHAGSSYLHVIEHDDGRKERMWCAPARWVRAVRELRSVGVRVILLDATVSDDVSTSLWGCAPTRVHVADAPTVTREWVYTSGARSAKLNMRDAARWMQHVAERAHARGAKHVGIITKRAWRDRLQRELRRQLHTDVKVSVGHFGALRGLDTMQDVDVLAVVGEQWHGLSDVAGEARVMEADTRARWQSRTEEELTQAEGRLRPVHRSSPALLLRYTATRPNLQLTPQWRQPGVTALPRARLPIDPKSGASLRAAKIAYDLNDGELAQLVGTSRSTLQRRLGSGHEPLDLTGICPRQDREKDQADTLARAPQARGAPPQGCNPGLGVPKPTFERPAQAMGQHAAETVDETVGRLLERCRQVWTPEFVQEALR